MIKLDENTDSILPYGLKGTPFEAVYKALQAVASTVWPSDASGLRASIGWAWYALNDPASLVSAASGKQFLQDVLISEQVPLVKSTQTQAELVDLLIAWLWYTPTFGQLEALYKPYAATVDIRPITDEDTQAIYPVTPVHGAFYVIVTDIDLSRPLTLAEALTIAERATPMGSKPFVLYDFDAPTRAYAELGYGDVCIYAGSDTPADVPIPPQPEGYVQADKSSIPIIGNSYYPLYDSNGNALTKQSGKTYNYVGCLDSNGNSVSLTARDPFGNFSGGLLVWEPLQSTPGGTLIQKVLYTET